MSTHVVIVGSYNQDHAWRVDHMPQPGETRRGHGFVSGPGGKGFNQAVGCVRQGVPTRFIGALGDDPLATLARATAEREGLDGRWQTVVDQPTGTACILVDASGQNQIVVDLAANEHLAPAFVRDQGDAFEGAGVLLVQLESPVDAVAAALDLAGEHHLLRLLNPAPMHAGIDRTLLDRVDVLIPNEGEFAALCNQLFDAGIDADAVAAMDDRTLHALARRLDVPTLVITLGRKGCFVSHGEDSRGDDTVFARVAAETAKTIDTTAAGDAFCGALAAALVRFPDAPFGHAVAQANRVAAMSTEHVGAAASIPSFDEVRARFGDR